MVALKKNLASAPMSANDVFATGYGGPKSIYLPKYWQLQDRVDCPSNI